MLENMTTGEKALIGATAIGIAALVFHKPTRNAVGLSDRSRTKKTKDLKVNRYTKDSKPYKHNFMMLGRLMSDNDVYIYNGKTNERRLWAGNVKDQIAEMKRLYNEIPKHLRPKKWLEQIKKDEKEMTS